MRAICRCVVRISINTHGYYNGTSVFLEVIGRAHQPCEVLIERPPEQLYQGWRVATSLARKQAEEFGFGLYQADDYDDLIDHPVEMGEFRQIRFEACGVPHDIILTGRFDCDDTRLGKRPDEDLRASYSLLR